MTFWHAFADTQQKVINALTRIFFSDCNELHLCKSLRCGLHITIFGWFLRYSTHIYR
jgi:hypothetical protein